MNGVILVFYLPSELENFTFFKSFQMEFSYALVKILKPINF